MFLTELNPKALFSNDLNEQAYLRATKEEREKVHTQRQVEHDLRRVNVATPVRNGCCVHHGSLACRRRASRAHCRTVNAAYM